MVRGFVKRVKKRSWKQNKIEEEAGRVLANCFGERNKKIENSTREPVAKKCKSLKLLELFSLEVKQNLNIQEF